MAVLPADTPRKPANRSPLIRVNLPPFCRCRRARPAAAHRHGNRGHRRAHRAKGGQWVKDQPHAGVLEFVDGEARRDTELGEIREHGHVESPAKRPVVVERGQGLGENHIGAGRLVGTGPVERGVQALPGKRIRARHHDEILVGARVDGGLQAVAHFARVDDRLVRPVAAAFGPGLILDVHRRDSGSNQLACRTGNVEGPAETGVDIGEQRQGGCRRDTPRVFEHVAERRYGEIRQAERSVRDAGAGQIDGFEPGPLGEQSAIGIDRPRHLQRRSIGHRGAKLCTGAHCDIQGKRNNGHGANDERGNRNARNATMQRFIRPTARRTPILSSLPARPDRRRHVRSPRRGSDRNECRGCA
jgi:hypothetical protein